MIRFCSIISSVQFLFSLGLSSGLNEQIEARQYFPYDSVNGRNGDWEKSSVTQHNDGATDHEENYIGETAGKKTNLSDFPGNCTVMNLSKNDKSNIDTSRSDGISKISEDTVEMGKRNNDSISSCTLLKKEKLNRYQFHKEKPNLKRYQRQKGREDHGLIFNSPNNEYTLNKSNDRQSFEKSFLNNSNETYTKFSPFQRNRLECLNEVETLENTNKQPKYKIRRGHNFNSFKGIKSQFITSNILNENRNRNKRTFSINKDIDENTDLKFDRNMRRVHTFHKSRRYKNRKINIPEKYNIVNKMKNSKLEQNFNDEKGMDIVDQNFLKVIQNKSVINSIHRQLIQDYFNDSVRQSKAKKDYIVKNRENIINTYNAVKKKYMSTTMGYQNVEETNYLDADKLFNFIVTTDKDGNMKEKYKLKMDTFDYSDHNVYHCNNYYRRKLSTVATGTVGYNDEEADYLDDLVDGYDESTDEAKVTTTSEHLNDSIVEFIGTMNMVKNDIKYVNSLNDFVEKLKHKELNPKDINKINDFIENIKRHKPKNSRYNDAMLKYFIRGKNVNNHGNNKKKFNSKINDYETQINCIPQVSSMTDIICDKMGMLNKILQNRRNYMFLPNYSNFIATTAQTTQCEVIGTTLSPDSSESYITASSSESYNTINIPSETPSDFVEQNTQLMDQRTEENSYEEISYENEWEETTVSDDTEIYSDSVGETLANIAKMEATQQRMRNNHINSSLEWNAMSFESLETGPLSDLVSQVALTKEIRRDLKRNEHPILSEPFLKSADFEYYGIDYVTQKVVKKVFETYFKCTDLQNKILQMNKGVSVEPVEAYEDDTTVMQCFVCLNPRYTMSKAEWYYAENITSIENSKKLDADPRKVISDLDDSLTIYYVKGSDKGFYYCSLQRSTTTSYMLTVLTDDDPTVIIHDDAERMPPEFPVPGVVMKTVWTPWSKCSQCGEGHVGRKESRGFCRLGKLEGSTKLPLLPEDDYILGYFKRGLPCRSTLLSNELKSLGNISIRPNELHIDYCKEPCEEKIFVVKNSLGKIVEIANNSEGVYSYLQGAPSLPPTVERVSVLSDSGETVYLGCPGHVSAFLPHDWYTRTKPIFPVVQADKTKRRVFHDEIGRLVIRDASISDSGVYLCRQGNTIAGIVRLRVIDGTRVTYATFHVSSIIVIYVLIILLILSVRTMQRRKLAQIRA